MNINVTTPAERSCTKDSRSGSIVPQTRSEACSKHCLPPRHHMVRQLKGKKREERNEPCEMSVLTEEAAPDKNRGKPKE
jgi:hypothetical protein